MCGDCCENIALSTDHGTIIKRLAQGYGTGRWRKDAVFILNNMRPTGRSTRQGKMVKQVLSCAKFDSVTRKCTAHDDRPELCSGYPWYKGEPITGDTTMGGRCSYLGDAYKMLPIVEVR
jgi:Fe-S-cluster containining protein